MSRGTPERAGWWTAFVDHVAQGGSGSASPLGSRRWLPPGWLGGGLALASSTVPVPRGPFFLENQLGRLCSITVWPHGKPPTTVRIQGAIGLPSPVGRNDSGQAPSSVLRAPRLMLSGPHVCPCSSQRHPKGSHTVTQQGDARPAVTETAQGLPPADAQGPSAGPVLTVQPGHPDGLDEHSEEDGCAGREVVQQREDIDAALEEGAPAELGVPDVARLAHEGCAHKRLASKYKPGLRARITGSFCPMPCTVRLESLKFKPHAAS